MNYSLYNIINNRLLQMGLIIILVFNPWPGKAQSPADSVIESPVTDSTAADENNEFSEEDTSEQVSRLPDTIAFRNVPDTAVTRLKKEKEFEYANNPAYWIRKKEDQKESKGLGDFLTWLFSSSAVRIIMYLLLAAVIIFTIYRIIINNNLFYTSSKSIKEGAEQENNEMEDEALDEKITAAVLAKEYRKAVRYSYFKTLRGLDAKGWIRYHAQATNYDYLVQFSKHSLASEFGFLTQVYEYVWYGGFELSDNQFDIVQSNFQKMYKSLGV